MDVFFFCLTNSRNFFLLLGFNGYPSGQPQTGYPGAQPGYPGSPSGYPGYPSGQPGYSVQPSYPGVPQQGFTGYPQGGYPGGAPTGYPNGPSYPGGYPGGAPTGYPSAPTSYQNGGAAGYPPQGGAMGFAPPQPSNFLLKSKTKLFFLIIFCLLFQILKKLRLLKAHILIQVGHKRLMFHLQLIM